MQTDETKFTLIRGGFLLFAVNQFVIGKAKYCFNKLIFR
jgi:hypothetical protein